MSETNKYLKYKSAREKSDNKKEETEKKHSR